METPSGNGATPKVEPKKDIELDISAFVPDPVSFIVVDEKRYGVLGLIDVPAKQALEALKLDIDIEKQTFEEQIIRARRQVQILVPGMQTEVLDNLSMRQLIRIGAQATRTSPPRRPHPRPLSTLLRR